MLIIVEKSVLFLNIVPENYLLSLKRYSKNKILESTADTHDSVEKYIYTVKVFSITKTNTFCNPKLYITSNTYSFPHSATHC